MDEGEKGLYGNWDSCSGLDGRWNRYIQFYMHIIQNILLDW